MLDFAQYTVASRAIPNMIDGMKPVQRFYLYSSLVNSRRDFKKVSAVAGVLSDYGYNHGEVSAAGAGQLMAATWRNNICLVEGRGSFGTRQVQAAGASRYVYTKVSANFDRYIKDLELSPAHKDPEHEPPAFYLPVLPLVLLNGAAGIATGFATNILPRDDADVIAFIRATLAAVSPPASLLSGFLNSKAPLYTTKKMIAMCAWAFSTRLVRPNWLSKRSPMATIAKDISRSWMILRMMD